MSKRFTIIFLSLISIVTLVLRVAFPFKLVFRDSFVDFLETDAWNRMMYAKSMAGMGFFESISYMVHNNLLFSWVVSVFGRFLPIEYVGAWLPPIIAVGVVIVVYFIGKELWDRNIGLIAALFVAVIPSEFLHRSLLGFADHHVLEVLLMALTVLFLIKAVKNVGTDMRFWAIMAGITFSLYMLNWKSGVYIMGIFFILLLIALLIRNLLMRESWHKSLLPVVLVGAVGLIIYLPIGGYRQLLYFIPGYEAQSVITTTEVVSTVTQAPSQRIISELMPLFFPFGSFNPGVVMSNLNLFVITFLVGLVYLWKMRHDKAIIIFTVWTFLMLAITLNERRFLYYLTLNVGILSAFAIFKIAQKFVKGNPIQNVAILTIPLLFLSVFFGRGFGTNPYQMTDEWHVALEWMKQQPDGEVTAWVDYGHWIQYVSGKSPDYLPGPGGVELAQFYVSQNDKDAKKYLEALGTAYLIVDLDTLKGRYPVLQMVADSETPMKSSLIYRLYTTSEYPSYLQLAYQSQTLKIFRYRG